MIEEAAKAHFQWYPDPALEKRLHEHIGTECRNFASTRVRQRGRRLLEREQQVAMSNAPVSPIAAKCGLRHGVRDELRHVSFQFGIVYQRREGLNAQVLSACPTGRR